MKKTCLVFVYLLVILAHSCFADVIKLKNGRVISGTLKEINKGDVVLDVKLGTSAGTVWFGKQEVESINNLSIEEAEAKLSTKDTVISGQKDEILISSANEGLNFVSKTRKLGFKSTPEIKVISKDKVKEYLNKNIEKNYSKEKLLAKAKLLKKLGIISDIEDYGKKVIALLTEEIAGYYDPEDKKIYIAENHMGKVIPGLPSITIMHEQVHALQDQYYDLKNMEEKLSGEDNEDKMLAFQGVVEGEATVLMFDASLRSFGVQDKSKETFDLRSFVIDSMLASSKRVKTEEGKPAIFVEDLLFPYVWGGTFIQHLVNTKGWEAVDTIYNDMPVSTEQIMHPEKYYIARDDPQKAELPGLSAQLGKPWLKLTHNTVGEFGFYLIGKVFLDELSTKLMSEGWGGDYFEFYEEPNSKQTLFISLSTWDTEKDADEFFKIYKQVIEKKYKQPSLVKEENNSYLWKTEEGNAYILKSKNAVVLFEGAPDDLAAGLTKALTI